MKVKDAIAALQEFDGDQELLTGIDANRTIYAFEQSSFSDAKGWHDYVDFRLVRSGVY